MTTHLVFLSDDAARLVAEVGPTLMQSVRISPGSLGPTLEEFALDDAICIVGEPELLDCELVATVQDAQIRRDLRIGLVPISKERPERVADLLTLDPYASSSSTESLYYSYHDGCFDVAGRSSSSVTYMGRGQEQDVVNRLSVGANQPLRVCACVVNGRETFCFFGSAGCLLAGMPDAPAGVVTCEDVYCEHWFLQTCHRPFLQPHIGIQSSVALSLLISGSARTVITSAGVQNRIPQILSVFHDLITAGCPQGEVVLRLNHYLLELGHTPQFVLYGHPGSRALGHENLAGKATAPNSNPRRYHELGRESRLWAAKKWHDARELLANLETLLTLAFPASARQTRQRHHPETRKLPAILTATRRWLERNSALLSGYYLPETSHEAVLDALNVPYLSCERRAANLLCEIHGYYYSLAEALEEFYVPDCRGIDVVCPEYRCVMCGARVTRRRISSVGVLFASDYFGRWQDSCPNCLVVRDQSVASQDIGREVTCSSPRTLRMRVTYTNRTDRAQRVFVVARANDPNDLPHHSVGSRAWEVRARRVASELIESLRMLPSWSSTGPVKEFELSNGWPGVCTFAGVTVSPGESHWWEISVDLGSCDIFYLLFEWNIVVDFTFNWLSFTYRSPIGERWLRSNEYRHTRPQSD